MTAPFRPFYVELGEEQGSSAFSAGKYLVLSVLFNPVIGQTQLLVTKHRDSKQRLRTVNAESFTFLGYVDSCIMCQWPAIEGEKQP